jgi:hypothetical protein
MEWLDREPTRWRGRQWRELHDLLKLGPARIATNQYQLPSFYLEDFPDLPGVNIGYMVATARNVRIRSAPRLSAPVIATASYHYLLLADDQDPEYPVTPPEGAEAVTIEGETYSWRKVIAPNGKTGYIVERYVRFACAGVILGFVKIQGAWTMNYANGGRCD